MRDLAESQNFIVVYPQGLDLAGTAYIAFLGGDDPIKKVEFAKHLLTASRSIFNFKGYCCMIATKHLLKYIQVFYINQSKATKN